MRTMEFSFHKVANYAAFFVFLCSVLLISGASTVQAENNAWVLDRVEYGTDQYTEWVVEAWGFKTEYSVSLGESQLKSTTKHTQTTMDGTVILWQDVEFIFDYVTPPEELIPGKNVSLTVEGTSSGDPWHESSSEGFMYYVDTWSYSGQRLEQIFSTQMGLDQENQSAVEINAFKVPDLVDGQLKIKVRLGMGAQFYVHFIYEPGTVTLEEEGFVLENTGTGEVKLNDVPLPPCSQSLQGFDRDVAVASEGCFTPLEVFDEILQGENSSSTISKDCLDGFATLVTLLFSDLLFSDEKEKGTILLFVITVLHAPELCKPLNSKAYAEGSGNRISLDLQSGGGRFKPALEDLALDIETDTAKASSAAKNDFAVGHDPDTTLTVAACYEGSVTVDPTNPTLSPVTLMKGQMVRVWSDRIGPITNIGQTIPVTILLLLDD